MAEAGSLIDCHLQLQCPTAAAAQAFEANLYAAVAALFPQYVTGGNPTTALSPAIIKVFHDWLVTAQAQSAAQQAVAAVTTAVQDAMTLVTPTVTVTLI